MNINTSLPSVTAAGADCSCGGGGAVGTAGRWGASPTGTFGRSGMESTGMTCGASSRVTLVSSAAWWWAGGAAGGGVLPGKGCAAFGCAAGWTCSPVAPQQCCYSSDWDLSWQQWSCQGQLAMMPTAAACSGDVQQCRELCLQVIEAVLCVASYPAGSSTLHFVWWQSESCLLTAASCYSAYDTFTPADVAS